MLIRLLIGAAAIVALSGATPKAARAVLPAAAADCEMHVWAKPLIKNDITGIIPGGALAAAETQPYRDRLQRGNSTVTQTLLTDDLLMRALKDSTIGTRFGIAPDQFILEPDNATQPAFVKSPRVEGEGCRYGFTFQMIIFQKSAVYGKQLVLYYNITDRNVGTKPRNVHWYNSENLRNFNPHGTDAEISAVLQDGVTRVINDIIAKKFPLPAPK